MVRLHSQSQITAFDMLLSHRSSPCTASSPVCRSRSRTVKVACTAGQKPLVVVGSINAGKVLSSRQAAAALMVQCSQPTHTASACSTNSASGHFAVAVELVPAQHSPDAVCMPSSACRLGAQSRSASSARRDHKCSKLGVFPGRERCQPGSSGSYAWLAYLHGWPAGQGQQRRSSGSSTAGSRSESAAHQACGWTFRHSSDSLARLR